MKEFGMGLGMVEFYGYHSLTLHHTTLHGGGGALVWGGSSY